MLGPKQTANPEKLATFSPATSQVTLVVIIGLIFCCLPLTVNAWTEPPNSPSGYYSSPTPTLNFLNASVFSQRKTGSLIIGRADSGAKLCLNSNSTLGTNDAPNCITSWDEVGGGVHPESLPLGKVAAGLGDNLNNYTISSGFSRIWANNQAAPGTDPGRRYTMVIEPSTYLSGTTAVLAMDRYAEITTPKPNNSAAVFEGRTMIGDGDIDRELCLNDSSFYTAENQIGCITKWSDIVYPYGGIGYLSLQNAGSTPTTEDGQISVASTAHFGTMTVGTATNYPAKLTCGDGLCQASERSAGSCDIDCQEIPSVDIFRAWPGDERVVFENSKVATSGSWSYLVLQKVGSAPTATPLNGATYSVGQKIGDATVAAVVSATSGTGSFLTEPITGLTNGQTYYFAAYAANAYPRYGHAVVTSAQPTIGYYPLVINFNQSSAAQVSATPSNNDGPSLLCGGTQNFCQGYYRRGTIINIQQEVINQRYTFVQIRGTCQSYTPECTINIAGASQVEFQYIVK